MLARSRRSTTALGLEALEDRRVLSVSIEVDRPQSHAPLDDADPLISSFASRFGESLSVDEILNLQSKPDSNFTIYLDFDGHVTEGTSWNSGYGISTIVTPPFDLDGNPTSFGPAELDRMLVGWQRSAEDFAPFDINVTTREPDVEDLIRSGGGDTRWGARVVITDDVFADCGCGGHAYIDSFNDSTDTPTFVYNQGEGSLGETISHEVGHMINLFHDGTAFGGLEYYGGHGTGTLGWGAIMGAPFNQNVTQWDRGEYFDANNSQNDLSDITTLNGFTYRSDDFGDSRATAGELVVDGGTNVRGFGIIETNSDRDFLSFETGTGDVSLSLDPLSERPNLDIWAGIYNAAGTLVAQSNPANSLAAGFTNLALTAGTYYLRVEGTGTDYTYQATTDSLVPPSPGPWTLDPPSGYSKYGSLGQYAIHGTIVTPSNDTFSIAPTDAIQVEGSSGSVPLTFTVTRSGNTSLPASVDYSFGATLPRQVGETYPSPATASDFTPSSQLNGSLSFLANEVSQTITLDVVGDGLFEQDEFFDLTLSNPSTGWDLATSQATGIIRSDESEFGILPLTATGSVLEGPYSGALVRWRQVSNASGAFDEWGLDNVSLANSTFADDFDPDIDAANWSEISNGTANTNFGGTGNSLFMSGGADRWATSQFLNAQPGDTLTFDLIFGDSTNGGENADPGEDVVLEYSLDSGSNWTVIETYDTEDYTTWTTLQAGLPSGIDTNPPGMIRFTANRDGGSALPATLEWQVQTAGLTNPADGNDFLDGVLPNGQVTFAADQTSTEVVVTINGDADFEMDEEFQLVLTSAAGSGTVSVDNDRDTGMGTILNDDSSYEINPGPQFRWRQLDNSSGNFDEWAVDNVGLSSGSFGDDFDPNIDPSQWDEVNGGSVNSNFGGSGNSLFFTGSDPRSLVSRAVSPQSGETLNFDFIYGDDNNGGENPEPGEEVVLEYSLDGDTWTLLQTFNLNITSWTPISQPVPTDAVVAPPVMDEGDSGATVFTFTVLRTGNTQTTSFVDWEVRGSGIDPATATDFVGGVLPSGSLTFAPNEMTKTVDIEVAGDTAFEPDETFDFVLLAGGTTPVTATILNDDPLPNGDFNGDMLVDDQDIDLLCNAIRTGDMSPLFDLTGDGQVNMQDMDELILNILDTLYGDANLDGIVDGSDFSVWNANKFASGTGWATGDFNCDGDTDGADFNVWNANKFQSGGGSQRAPVIFSGIAGQSTVQDQSAWAAKERERRPSVFDL